MSLQDRSEPNSQHKYALRSTLSSPICFIFTEWPEVKAMRGADFLNMKHPIVLDGRNCLVMDVEEARILYESIGSLPSCVEKR